MDQADLEKIDAFIAEHLMGLQVRAVNLFGHFINYAGKFKDGNCEGVSPVLPYSTCLPAAWQVFEELGPSWQISQSDVGGYSDDQRWWCWLPTEYGGDGTVYMAPTPALAICKAAMAMAEKETV